MLSIADENMRYVLPMKVHEAHLNGDFSVNLKHAAALLECSLHHVPGKAKTGRLTLDCTLSKLYLDQATSPAKRSW